MKHNELVKLRSGLEISRLSLGTAAFGGLYKSVSAKDCEATVKASLKNGLRFFDTAPHYGKGVSERRLGIELSRHPRDTYIVSSKVGRVLIPTDYESDSFFKDADVHLSRKFDFSAAGIRKSLEDSLERLELEKLDIVFIHDPDDFEEDALQYAYPELEKMKSEGLLSSIGIGMNQTRIPTRFIYETDIDIVLMAGRFTLLDQIALNDLLPAALEKKVDVIAAGVFNSGILADPDNPAATYNYEPASREMRDRARKIKELIDDSGYSITGVAMQFPLRHPAVKSVLVGCRSEEEVLNNIANFNVDIEENFWKNLVAIL